MTPHPESETPADPPPPPERLSAFADVPWRWSDVAVGLAPLLAARVAAAVLDPKAAAAAAPWWAWWTLTLAGMGWMLAFPLWVIRRRGGPPVRLPTGRRALVEVLVAIPVMVAVWIPLAAVVTVWMWLTGAADAQSQSLDRLAGLENPLLLAMLLLTAVAVAPVAEEVFFRGMLYNALRQKFGAVTGAVLQAAVFGLAHTFGDTHSVAAGVLGLAFAAVYSWRRTLLSTILLHFFQNTAAAIVTLSLWAAAANAPVLGLKGEPAYGGLRVVEVVPDSGAADAGLRPGDVLTAVDGQPVADIRDVIRAVRVKRAGDQLAVEFTRDGQAMTALPELKARPRPE